MHLDTEKSGLNIIIKPKLTPYNLCKVQKFGLSPKSNTKFRKILTLTGLGLKILPLLKEIEVELKGVEIDVLEEKLGVF